MFKNKNIPIIIKLDIEGGEWEIVEQLLLFIKKKQNIKYFRAELHYFKQGSTYYYMIDHFINKLEKFFKVYSLKDNQGTTVTVEGYR